MKKGEVRLTEYCLCGKKGKCFDRVEEVVPGELAWVIHCKTLKKISNEAMKLTNKTIGGEKDVS